MSVSNPILVLGSSGLVGSRFVELYPEKDTLLVPNLKTLDITDNESVMSYLNEHKPATILNFAAFTDVGKAEMERNNKAGVCWKLNCEAVKYLCDYAQKHNVHLIQISTDMVFSGSKKNRGPYSESDHPEKNSNMVTWYGYSKYAGEIYVNTEESTLVRIIYPVRAHFKPKLDYFRKPLQLYDEGKLYPLFFDQYLSITFIDDLCLALSKIIKEKQTGIFHVSSPDLTTPHHVITQLLKKTRGFSGKLASTTVESMANPIRYPQFGGLDCRETEKKLSMKFKKTTEIIDALVEQEIGQVNN